ncbi:FCD domain-containing protein [Saccharopolyspora sp. CA-218241]|uniref:FCD domain-containing protein n=1 Tax=Saccharopolyspora sp. CA-218241 TaxID=3240027 RepID=UPI003D97E218
MTSASSPWFSSAIVEIGLRARDRIAHSREGWHTTVDHHARIADAVARRAPDRAEEATRTLLEHSAASLERSQI